MHNSIGVKTPLLEDLAQKFVLELIFLRIFLKITLCFFIIMQINNKRLMQVVIILPSCR